jgi:exosome complex component RRP43
MTEQELYKKIHPNKYLRNYLEKDVRPDSRKLLEWRPVIINTNSLSSCEGSALVKIGNTSIMCGIKAVSLA